MSRFPKILFTSYECAPFYKQGGLADVAGSLPKALKELGVDIRVVIPYYWVIKKNYPKIKKYKSNIRIKVGQKNFKVNIYKSSLPNSRVTIYFIDNKKYLRVKDVFDKKMRQRFILFPYFILELIKIAFPLIELFPI